MCPMLILHGLGDGITTFNRLPIHIARHSERLMRLASAPFGHFRFFGPEYRETGETYPLDLVFLRDRQALGPIDRLNARPVVFWSAQEDAVDVAELLLTLDPLLLLFIYEKPEQLKRFPELTRRPNPVASLMALDSDGYPFSDLSRRIWTAYLELVQRLFADANALSPVFTFAPWLDKPTPFSEVIKAAHQGSSVWCGDTEPKLIPNDYVAAPNYILLSLLQTRTPPWSREPLQPDEAPRRSVEMAHRILATRGLDNLLGMLKRTGAFKEPDEQLLGFLDEFVPRDFLERVIEWTRLSAPSPESGRLLHELSSDRAIRLSPPQVILLCPGAADVQADRIAIPPGLQGRPAEAAQREPGYYRHVFECVAQSGRRREVRAPENPDQELILQLTGQMVRAESQHLSAIGLFYAGRFSCPLLKLDYVDRTVIGAFQQVNAVFDAMEGSDAGVYAAPEAASQLHQAICSLGSTVSALFGGEYMGFLRNLATQGGISSCLIHALSDFPVDFAQIDGEWLGYLAEVSRTPITPGDLPVINYWTTEEGRRLPTRVTEFLLVTPFAEDDPLLSAVIANKPAHVPEFRMDLIRRRADLLRRLQDPTVQCLVYFGEGYYDSDLDTSALVLQDDFLYAGDIAAAERVPPVVVLIGCNTTAAGSLLGGFHTALFRAGARLIVGSAFPIPKVIGAQFLNLWISNLLSPSVAISEDQSVPYRDLAQVFTVVRRRLRVTSDLFSLAEQGRITETQMIEAVNSYAEKMERISLLEGANDWVQLDILRDILVDLKVIPTRDATVNSWGAVPYPLFFSLLGFPWTTVNEKWPKRLPLKS